MPEAWRRALPFVLTGLLLFTIVDATVNGGQGRWIRVAVIALVLALTLWWRRRVGEEPKDPHQRVDGHSASEGVRIEA